MSRNEYILKSISCFSSACCVFRLRKSALAPAAFIYGEPGRLILFPSDTRLYIALPFSRIATVSANAPSTQAIMSSPPTISSAVLGHVSLNPSASESILLLHGAGSSHREWSSVWPHLLPRYHVLAVDLPGHAASSGVGPAEIPAQATVLAPFVRENAVGGRAHVVGLSMGGFVALELARQDPAVVMSVFVSGAAPLNGWRLWAAQHESLVDAVEAAWGRAMPRWLIGKIAHAVDALQGLTVSDELRRDRRQPGAAGGGLGILASIGEVRMEAMEHVTARTLTVAGGRMDDVEATRRQGAALRRGCAESRAAVVRHAWHPWNLQLPELFAAGVYAWAKGLGELPEGFEELR